MQYPPQFGFKLFKKSFLQTQPLTEISTRNVPGGGKARPARNAGNLMVTCEPIVYTMSDPRRLQTL
jgi:hypothetical protein